MIFCIQQSIKPFEIFNKIYPSQIRTEVWCRTSKQPPHEPVVVKLPYAYVLLGLIGLTHLPLDKMAAISQTILSEFVNEKFCILIKISLKFVLKSPIDNNSALV